MRCRPEGTFDAAFDVMGLHMLITEGDRDRYLKNAFDCLRAGAPMLFYRESYRQEEDERPVGSYEEWVSRTGCDYKTPELRKTTDCGREKEVMLPLIAARARSKEGYLGEMRRAGFLPDDFRPDAPNDQCVCSASFCVHKP